MNAPVNPSLLLPSVAAEELAKCRAIISGDEMTPEQFVMSEWWKGLNRVKRSAFFDLAGINYGNTGKAWTDLPDKQRAALVLAVHAWSENLKGIMTTLERTRLKARELLEQEARKASRPRVKHAA